MWLLSIVLDTLGNYLMILKLKKIKKSLNNANLVVAVSNFLKKKIKEYRCQIKYKSNW